MDNWFQIYKNGGWKNQGSGPGSKLENNQKLINWLLNFIKINSIKSIIDLPCGDMQWMPNFLKETSIQYLGIDYIDFIIKENKEKYPNLTFNTLNILYPIHIIGETDLLFVKDLLQHFTENEIEIFFENIKYINHKLCMIILPFYRDWISFDDILKKHNFTRIYIYNSDEVKSIYIR